MDSERVNAARRAEAEAVVRAPAPAPAPAPRPALAEAPVAPQGLELRAQAAPGAGGAHGSPSLPAGWTHLRRRPEGTAIAREQAGSLPQSLAMLRAGEASQTVGALNVLQRIELLRDGQVLGVLTLYGQGWRYQPANAAEAERMGPVDAITAERLSDELNRLMLGR